MVSEQKQLVDALTRIATAFEGLVREFGKYRQVHAENQQDLRRMMERMNRLDGPAPPG